MNHQRKRYNRQFKEQAIELVRLGKSVPEVAGELEITPNNLYRWIRKSTKPAPDMPRLCTASQQFSSCKITHPTPPPGSIPRGPYRTHFSLS